MVTARVRELILKFSAHESGVHADARQIKSPADAAAILVPLLQDEPQEVFLCLLLSAKHTLIAVHEVSRGGTAETLVDPKVLFRAVIACPRGPVTTIILAHNHPSGDPQPSADDIALTRQLINGGKILGVDVQDHIIVGDGSYCSFKETGRL